MPEHICTMLEAHCTFLPGSAAPPVFPFTGIVINLNVSTRGHRDHKDRRCCLILCIKEGEGGDLVMVEPGVVVRMENGDSFLLHSFDITHLNMPYEGVRASLVFHSDQDLDNWVKDRNGWATKSYFSDKL